ncbi:hypothetical protein V2J09_018071 [Rumex salicifolius]
MDSGFHAICWLRGYAVVLGGRGSVGTGEDLNSPGYIDSESDDGSSTGSVSLSQGGSVTVRLVHGVGYKIVSLEERHTHELVAEKDIPFMRSMRKLNFGQKKFVMDCEKASIGPVRYRLFKEIVEGYSQVGASAVDFKNYRRDMLAYIGGSDTQMTINKFLKKKELSAAFFFEYDVDACDCLTRLFWADPMCRKNYSLFGDVVSFDATYRTNRSEYPMEYGETRFGDFYSCVGLLDGKADMMKAFSLHMMQQKEALLPECADSATNSISIQQNLEKYCRVEVPSDVDILPPEQAKNKGSCSRIPNRREVSMAVKRSGQRRCGITSHVSLVDPMNVSMYLIAYSGEPMLSPVSAHGNWTITGLDNAARRDLLFLFKLFFLERLINNICELDFLKPSLCQLFSTDVVPQHLLLGHDPLHLEPWSLQLGPQIDVHDPQQHSTQHQVVGVLCYHSSGNRLGRSVVGLCRCFGHLWFLRRWVPYRIEFQHENFVLIHPTLQCRIIPYAPHCLIPHLICCRGDDHVNIFDPQEDIFAYHVMDIHEDFVWVRWAPSFLIPVLNGVPSINVFVVDIHFHKTELHACKCLKKKRGDPHLSKLQAQQYLQNVICLSTILDKVSTVKCAKPVCKPLPNFVEPHHLYRHWTSHLQCRVLHPLPGQPPHLGVVHGPVLGFPHLPQSK